MRAHALPCTQEAAMAAQLTEQLGRIRMVVEGPQIAEVRGRWGVGQCGSGPERKSEGWAVRVWQ
eukprot:1149081-Pelagomonas_calceolata.AAC.4